MMCDVLILIDNFNQFYSEWDFPHIIGTFLQSFWIKCIFNNQEIQSHPIHSVWKQIVQRL